MRALPASAFPLAFLPLPLLLFACSGKDDSDTNESDADTDADADTDTDADSDADTDTDTDADASVSILTPGNGGSVYLSEGGNLTWAVEGIVLDPNNVGGENADGAGHVHVYLDNEYMAATAETAYAYENLTAGEHTFSVRLAENDHTETVLNASDEVTVTVLSPGVVITDPVMDSTLHASSASLDIGLTDFAISQNVGMAAVVGEGHYHIYVDGLYFDYGTVTTDALVPRLAEGNHTITVVLADNDHSEIDVEASVDVTVGAGSEYVAIDSSPFAGEYGSASVPLDINVANFTLGGGRGYNVYVDDVFAGESDTSTITLRHVSSGSHWVEVRLHGSDGTETGARDYIRMTVAADARDINITSPADGEAVTGDFNLQATATNYVFDPGAVGGANAEGTGHYHIYVDGVYWTYGVGSATVTGVPSGTHEILVELVNNDHTTASPTASDVITLTVN